MTDTAVCGLIPRRIRTVASFTGRVKVIWNAVLGEARSPTIRVAVIAPVVGSPDWNDASTGLVRPRPSWSVAFVEMSTVYWV